MTQSRGRKVSGCKLWQIQTNRPHKIGFSRGSVRGRPLGLLASAARSVNEVRILGCKGASASTTSYDTADGDKRAIAGGLIT